MHLFQESIAKLFGIPVDRYRGVDQPVSAMSKGMNESAIYQIVSTFNSMYQFLTTSNSFSDEEKVEAYREITYACIILIAENVAQQTFKIVIEKGNGEYEEVPDHRAGKLLRDPMRTDTLTNLGLSQFDLFKLLSLHELIYGRGYWKIGLTQNDPSMIEPLPPDQMFPHLHPTQIVDYYIYRTAKGDYKIPARQIFHMRNISPRMKDFFVGYSAVGAASWSIRNRGYMETTIANIFLKGGLPDALIGFPQGTTQESQQTSISNLRRLFTGVREDKERIAGLPFGFDMKLLNPNLKELEYVKNLETLRDGICAIFRVPPSMLGLRESVSQADADEQNRSFMRSVIKPRIIQMEQQINLDFMPLFGEPGLRIKYDEVVPDNLELDNRITNEQFKSGLITRDEARQTLGWDPIDNAPVFYFDVVPVPSFGSTNFGSMDEETPPPDEEDPKPSKKPDKKPSEDDEEDEKKNIKRFRPVTKQLGDKRFIFKNNGSTDRDFWVHWRDHAQKKYDIKLVRLLNDYFSDLHTRVIENLNHFKGYKDKLGIVTKITSDDLDGILPAFDEERGRLFERTDEFIRNFFSLHAQMVADIFTEGYSASPIAFDMADPRVLNYFRMVQRGEKGAFLFTWEAPADAIEDIRQAILDGLEEGLDYKGIGRKIDSVMADYTQAQGWKAIRIAQTETNKGLSRAQLEGSLQVAREIDATARKHWYSAFLVTSRESHKMNDAYSREKDGIDMDSPWPFMEGNTQMDHPGDGDAKDAINCHCASGVSMKLNSTPMANATRIEVTYGTTH